VAQAASPANTQATGADWPKGFAVQIDYELPQIAAGTYHSPVVAIWISDEDKKLVRSLLILGYQNRYREEVYIYWRRFGRLNVDLADSVTKPTRGPGRYSIKWDGLDDTGKKVPQGKYILNIEASREKGGHSVQRLELTLGASGAVVDGAPAEEMGKVRATYGRGT
jgi:thiamine biosynthesis lipoprotein